MKQRIRSLFLALAMALSLVTVPAAAAGEPAVSSNKNMQDQAGYYAVQVRSYLFENQAGGLTRVETIGDQIVVEDYSSDFQLQSSRTLPLELSTWGGFFAGEDYNFFIFGQSNPQESDSVEVIRVVKYSKDWQRLDQASLYGANTSIPFRAGSLRCAEYGGELYIRTCHQMYKSSDGLNHQANLTLCVDQERMTVLDSYYIVMNSSVGYVSHSFNQFVLVDQDQNLVTLDHGDAYPRSAILMKYQTKAGKGKFSGYTTNYTIQTFPGQVGDNTTGASLGGLAETSSGYLVAYNFNGTGGYSPTERTVYVSFVPKSGGAVRSSAISAAGATTPHLVSMGLSGGYVLWNGKENGVTTNTLYYASYDAEGHVGAVQTAVGSLSGCAPIEYQGKAVWYATNNSAPVFYTLDQSGLHSYAANSTPQPESASSFLDVSSDHWAYSYITRAAKNGWIAGSGDGNFAPNDTLTYAQFYTMVTPIFRASALAAYQAGPDAPWWERYMWVGSETLMANTIWFETQTIAGHELTLQESVEKHANEAIPRTDAISIMWRALGAWTSNEIVPGVDAARDKLLNAGVSLNELELDTVPVCYAAGLISGDESGDLKLQSTLTRAEGCVMLCNLVDYADSLGIATSGFWT